MALFILQPGIEPLGQFDVLDTDAANIVGGLIGTLDETSRVLTSTETAKADVFDGYVADKVSEGSNTAYRPVIRIADTDGGSGGTASGDDSVAMFLMDEGIANYGTLFGSVIGMYNVSGTAVGPSTLTGSGKVTCWDKPGLYAVSFEACYSNKNVTNGALEAGQDTPLPGDILYRHGTTGKITRYANTHASNAHFNKIGVYVEHADKASLVTTPAQLVGASQVFDRIVFNYFGANKNV